MSEFETENSMTSKNNELEISKQDTEETTKAEEQKPTAPGYKIVSFTLPDSGIDVEIDMSKCTIELLDEARKVGEYDGDAVQHHMISKMATFNGETLSVPEIKHKLRNYAFDFVALEMQFGELRKKPENVQVRISA